MNDATSSSPDESGSKDSKPALIARRTVVAAAAWAPPVIAMSMATPAMAASTNATISLAFANNTPRPVGTSLADAVATVRSKNGVPLPGERVTLQIAGGNLAGGYFTTPGTTTLTGTTNAAGQFAATGLTAAKPGTLALYATLVGTSTSAYAQIRIVGAPTTIALTVTPPSVPTGGSLASSSALVTVDGAPAANQRVRFTVTGPAAFPNGATSYETTTNDQGVATATGLTASTSAGAGNLTATALDTNVSDTERFTVTAPAYAITLTLDPTDPAPGASMANSYATVTRNGQPLGSEAVVFQVQSGSARFPNGQTESAGVTSSGTGRVSLAGLTAGTTTGAGTIRAYLGRDDTVEATATYTVTAPPTPPGTVETGKLRRSVTVLYGETGYFEGYRDDLSSYTYTATTGAELRPKEAAAIAFASTWRTYTQANGRFYLQNVATGKYLSLDDAGTNVALVDAPLVQWDFIGRPYVNNQRLQFHVATTQQVGSEHAGRMTLYEGGTSQENVAFGLV